MSTRYTVRPGESLGSIASQNGLRSWRDIYDHPDNAAFRARRPNPNLIAPGDVIIIPDGPKPAMDPGSKTPAGASTTSAAATTTAPNPCALPPTCAFGLWPAELLATLCRSWQAHGSGNRYLDNVFWGGAPATFEDALNRLGSTAQHALTWVYGRAAPILGLWPFVQYIHNIWATDSHGFAFTCTDRARLRAFLDGSASFCRDTPIMMSDHQTAGPAQCWREVVNGGAGLHICIPVSDNPDQGTVPGESNMHIDPHQIVESKQNDGVCNYSASGVVGHARDVGAGVARRMAERALRELRRRAGLGE